MNDPAQVVVDLSEAHIWDASTVAALDAITTKYAHRGSPSRETRYGLGFGFQRVPGEVMA